MAKTKTAPGRIAHPPLHTPPHPHPSQAEDTLQQKLHPLLRSLGAGSAPLPPESTPPIHHVCQILAAGSASSEPRLRHPSPHLMATDNKLHR